MVQLAPGWASIGRNNRLQSIRKLLHRFARFVSVLPALLPLLGDLHQLSSFALFSVNLEAWVGVMREAFVWSVANNFP